MCQVKTAFEAKGRAGPAPVCKGLCRGCPRMASLASALALPSGPPQIRPSAEKIETRDAFFARVPTGTAAQGPAAHN